jgi:indole-3-glycerol phosphate synthase
VPLDRVVRAAQRRTPAGHRFRAALAREGGANIIAECKRRSPARGVLARAYDPAAIARGYERAGAAAVSVLTEPTFFDGALAHLEVVRAAVSLPVLRKDFVIDDYQIYEARAAGADAVLLIVALLGEEELRRLVRCADALGLAALVEVHTREELQAAASVGAGLIGVNSRNLRTLDVDVRVCEEMIAHAPGGAIMVAESGIRSRADIDRLTRAGYHAYLVGERLMAAADPADALAALLAPAPLAPPQGAA